MLSFRIPAALGLMLATASAPAGPGSFDRLVADWQHVRDYSVTLDDHEALGAQTDDHEFHYAYRAPDRARLDVVSGTNNGSTIVWTGGSDVVAYRRSLSFFKKRADAHQADLTSIRGNGILELALGNVVACFSMHRDDVRESDGPLIAGEPTAEFSLSYRNFACPYDTAADRGIVTLDVLDVSRTTGLIVRRKRYAGGEIVESLELADLKINAGVNDAELK